MIGKFQVPLGYAEFISGMSSSDYSKDGGLGTSCVGLNPFVVPGVMYGLANGTDISTNVAGNIIASCEDSNSTSPNNRYLVDDKANYYSYNGSAITKVKTGAATTKYKKGKLDFISFDSKFFATLTDALAKWDGSTTLDEAFFSFSDGSAHHPVLIFEGSLFIADGNVLLSMAANGSGTATPATALTLSSKEKIVALGIDPATGYMMISIQTVYDLSDTIPSLKAVYLWNGGTIKPARKILVDDMITAFFNLEGRVYVGAGQTLGVWNGSGVTFLRKFKNVTLSQTDLPYKHNFTNTRNILHVIDGNQVLSYGAVVTGKMGFFYTAYAPTGSASQNFLSCIFPCGSNRIAVAYDQGSTTYKVYSFDYSSTSAAIPSIYFNSVYFPRPVWIRKIRIITAGVTTTNAGGIGSLTVTSEDSVYTTTPLTFIVPAAQSPKYVFDFDFEIKLQGFFPRINLDTQGIGIIQVYAYYDIAE